VSETPPFAACGSSYNIKLSIWHNPCIFHCKQLTSLQLSKTKAELPEITGPDKGVLAR
jgi:hypothetical protein